MKTRSKIDVLNHEEMGKIKQTALKMLHEVGILIECPEAAEMMKKYDYRMDGQRLKPTPEETMEFIRNYSRLNTKKTGWTREEMLPLKTVALGVCDVNIYDWDLKKKRRGTLDDARKAALFVNELEYVSGLHVAVLPAEVHPELAAIAAIIEASKYTDKVHGFGGGQQLTPRNLEYFVEMGSLLAGGREAYMKNPMIGLAGFNMTSPMKLSKFVSDRTRLTMQFNILGGGVQPLPMPGLNAPVSLAGCIAQSFAEAFGGGMFMEMIEKEMTGEPRYAFSLEPSFVPADMRTTREACAAIENTLGHIAIEQMREFFNLPAIKCNYGSGKTESKIWDIQNGSEKMLGTVFPLLGGLRWGPKFLGEMCTNDYFSFEQAIIDYEFIEMGNRIIRGINVDDSALDLNVFKEGVETGMFTALEHTVENFRREMYLPGLASREYYENWDKNGRVSIEEKAHEKVVDVLKHAEPKPKYDLELINEMEKLLDRFKKDFE